MHSNTTRAALFAGTISAALLLGALGFQYLAGLAPCEMCIWQRWPHGLAILFGLLGGALLAADKVPPRTASFIAAVAIFGLAVSGLIGIFHAGVEWHLWEGPTACTTPYTPGEMPKNGVFSLVRCDEAQWRLFGISLAGYNAVISLACAAFAAQLMRKKAP